MKQLLGLVAVEMATREFSKNPSKALRKADIQPVLVTKYGQPIACVLSIDCWNSVVDKLHDHDIRDRMNR